MANQPQGLNGMNVLGYMGVNPTTPMNFKTYNRAPTTNDSLNFLLGDHWEFQSAQRVWILVAKTAGVATWREIIFDGAESFNFVTDAGIAAPIGEILNVFGGLNMNTAGATNTITINLDTSISQPATSSDGTAGLYSLAGSDFMHAFGTNNTFLGSLAGNRVQAGVNSVGIGSLALNNQTSGSGSTAVGYRALTSTQTSPNNTAVGLDSLFSLTGGLGRNVSVGQVSMRAATTAIANTAIGSDTLSNLLTGTGNVVLGFGSGVSLLGAENYNVLINNDGLAAESNTIRIGEDGSGAFQQNAAYVAGIYAGSLGATNKVTMVDSNGKLAGSAGNDGQVLIGDTGGSPAWANITSPDGSIVVTNGANTIALSSVASAATCSFFASLDVSVNNVTGDGTFYTPIYDLVDWDIGGDYDDTTGIFTAPVNGYYTFTAALLLQGLTNNNGTSCIATFVDNGPNSIMFSDGSFFASSTTFSTVGEYGTNGTYTAKLAAGDTMKTNIKCGGGAGTLSVNLIASSSPGDFRTYFSGYLIATY